MFVLSYPDVDVLLGAGLEELEAEAVCQMLAALVGNHALVLHVALVPDQDHLDRKIIRKIDSPHCHTFVLRSCQKENQKTLEKLVFE